MLSKDPRASSPKCRRRPTRWPQGRISPNEKRRGADDVPALEQRSAIEVAAAHEEPNRALAIVTAVLALIVLIQYRSALRRIGQIVRSSRPSRLPEKTLCPPL